jgi:hypothetical protein
MKSLQYHHTFSPPIESKPRNIFMQKELRIAATIAIITLTLAGCASNPDSASNLVADAKQSETITQINELKQTIDAADNLVAQGIEGELNWFATEEVDEADKALAEAKEYYAKFEFDPLEANSSAGFFSSMTNMAASKEGVSKFNEHMQKAATIKAAALSALSEAFDYRTQLKNIDAKKYFPATVKELEADLKKLVDQVSNGKIEEAITAQPALVSKQRALEIKTVTTIYLTDVKKELDRLVKAETAQHAPKSLSQASASLTAATAFIAAEPRSIDKIKLKAQEAMFSIKRAEQIALTVKKLKALPQKDYEDYIINYENILLDISKALGTEDHRYLAFEGQGKALVTFIESNLKDQEESVQLLQQLRKKLKDQESYAELLEEKINSLTVDLVEVKKSLAAKEAQEKAAMEQAATEQDQPKIKIEESVPELTTDTVVEPETAVEPEAKQTENTITE